MNMGSSSAENCSQNGIVDDHAYEDVRSKRPEFFPCSDCGRKFTPRAMQIHKRSCLETEDCECLVCKSDAKRFKFENMENNNEVSGIHPHREFSLKSKGNNIHMKPRLRDLLTGKVRNFRNGTFAENSLITFKLVEKDSHIIDKMVADSQSAKSHVVSAAFKVNESAAFNDHKYVSIPPELSENSLISDTDFVESSMKQVFQPMEVSEKFEDHDGEPCNRKIFCSICNEHIFWESFGVHVVQHCETVDNSHLKCPKCDKTFSKPAMILTHFFVHISDHPLDCSSCHCGNAKCIDARNATAEHCYAENSVYYCYICLNRFSHGQTLINHMRLHSKEMPFKCTDCNRSFRQIGNLQRHIAIHRGDRPHKCPNCRSSFADPATLRNHVRVHTGETPFVCHICSRGFSQVGNLKRHLARHMQKDESSTTFSSTVEMIADENTISVVNPPDMKINANTPPESVESNNHIEGPAISDSHLINIASHCDIIANGKGRKRKKNQMKVYVCEICKKIYTWHHDLSVHLRTHTGEKPYACDLCNRRFAQSGAVRTHKDRYHPNEATGHSP